MECLRLMYSRSGELKGKCQRPIISMGLCRFHANISSIPRRIRCSPNYDQFILSKREESYVKHRKTTFERMWKKHLASQCISVSLNAETISTLYDEGVLNILYTINQSITQSLRFSAGHEFENLVADILTAEDIPYRRQVRIGKHKADFVIDCLPPLILSVKTTLRERYLQDAYLPNVIYITLDRPKKYMDNICTIDALEMNLSRLIADLKTKTQLK